MPGRVIVAGAGMSGLAAACAALEAGADVTVLEKGPHIGGSLRLSNGFLVTFDNVQGIRSAVPDGDIRLQELTVSSFPRDAAWLSSLGVPLAARQRVGGRSGYVLNPLAAVATLEARVVQRGGRIHLATGLTRLARADLRITGAQARDASRIIHFPADAVVLATGGFQGNPELLARLCHLRAEKLYHRANPSSTGDGLLAALHAGAAVSGCPGGFYGHAMAAEPARVNSDTFAAVTQYQGNEAVALNLAGLRFADESEGTGEEVLNQALARQPDATGFYLGDDALTRLDAPHGSGTTVARILERTEALGGAVLRAATLEELCAGLTAHGADGAAALRTLRDYRSALRQGEPGSCGIPRKRNRHALDHPPFWAVKVRSGITFTTGGLAADGAMGVLERAGSTSVLATRTAPHGQRELAIPGLFCAGADVGGISATGYAGGLAAALVTGRAAGTSAARFAAGADAGGQGTR